MSCAAPNICSARRPSWISGVSSIGGFSPPTTSPERRPQRKLLGATAPETRPSAVPSTISIFGEQHAGMFGVDHALHDNAAAAALHAVALDSRVVERGAHFCDGGVQTRPIDIEHAFEHAGKAMMRPVLACRRTAHHQALGVYGAP